MALLPVIPSDDPRLGVDLYTTDQVAAHVNQTRTTARAAIRSSGVAATACLMFNGREIKLWSIRALVEAGAVPAAPFDHDREAWLLDLAAPEGRTADNVLSALTARLAAIDGNVAARTPEAVQALIAAGV